MIGPKYQILVKKEIEGWSDERLMELFQTQNSSAALDVLYERYFEKLCKYLSWLSGARVASEDIVQNIFLNLLAKPFSFDTNKVFRYWIYRSAKNLFLNEIRNSNTREKQINQYSLISTDNSAAENSNQKDANMKRVQNAIRLLSEKHRETFVLKYSSNFSIEEISEILSCSQGTVKSRLFYAIKEIKNILQKDKSKVS